MILVSEINEGGFFSNVHVGQINESCKLKHYNTKSCTCT